MREKHRSRHRQVLDHLASLETRDHRSFSRWLSEELGYSARERRKMLGEIEEERMSDHCEATAGYSSVGKFSPVIFHAGVVRRKARGVRAKLKNYIISIWLEKQLLGRKIKPNEAGVVVSSHVRRNRCHLVVNLLLLAKLNGWFIEWRKSLCRQVSLRNDFSLVSILASRECTTRDNWSNNSSNSPGIEKTISIFIKLF